ncbi:MAG: tRNA 2-thiocytidine biosynthesis protein TtcA [Oscillospiraceae bacterium]|nr:tRNA 2-thiocytidine biosynthesis protein TtcA [Oscillospiraceae bacterium]MBR0392825.1 tRNA 2-thiocytidine biosynthesis protein TtcA [Oscillospiraceae bacterium]
MSRELSFDQQVEQSINKKFHKTIWRPFINAVKQYEMIQEGDRIAACVSGGKDSFLNAKLLQMLQRHSDVPFELVFLVMDPGYNEENRRMVEENARRLNIPITVFQSDIFDVTAAVGGSPCYLCARMRRGFLYSHAKELGCNKIALGHHLSDVIETTLMGMFYGAQLQAMLPKLHSTNFEGMTLIRPLYCVHEDAILAWVRYNGLHFIQCACRFTENLSDEEAGSSKRQEIKLLIRSLREENPGIDRNIFNSIHTVHLDTFPGFKTDGAAHSFLEKYDREENGEKNG